RPRQDRDTGRVDVTDVRLKRTVRDYIYRYRHQSGKADGLDIFVQVARERALIPEERYKEVFGVLPKPEEIDEASKMLKKHFVDVRLFGALLPIRKKEEEVGAGIHLTGAVQFNMGQSLHATEVKEISGTGGFAARPEAAQKTFRREFIVPYALIGFYGVINENVAVESGLTQQDVDLLMESLWEGTKTLHSRSKAFHHPRLLVRLDFKNQNQIGYFLDQLRLTLKRRVEDERRAQEMIRSTQDYVLDIDPWLQLVEKKRRYLERVYCHMNSGIPLKGYPTSKALQKKLKELTKKLEFVTD
ncbi:MAG: type I-B CRISPR-associated protein Cas7/Csh2, partial [Candidatus Thermoplasmatota archaeon]